MLTILEFFYNTRACYKVMHVSGLGTIQYDTVPYLTCLEYRTSAHVSYRIFDTRIYRKIGFTINIVSQ